MSYNVNVYVRTSNSRKENENLENTPEEGDAETTETEASLWLLAAYKEILRVHKRALRLDSAKK